MASIDNKVEVGSKEKTLEVAQEKRRRPLRKRRQQETFETIIRNFRGKNTITAYHISGLLDCHHRTAFRYLKLLTRISELFLEYGIVKQDVLHKGQFIIEDIKLDLSSRRKRREF